MINADSALSRVKTNHLNSEDEVRRLYLYSKVIQADFHRAGCRTNQDCPVRTTYEYKASILLNERNVQWDVSIINNLVFSW